MIRFESQESVQGVLIRNQRFAPYSIQRFLYKEAPSGIALETIHPYAAIGTRKFLKQMGPKTRTVEIELDEGVLRALESNGSYFPFACTDVEQRAAMVLNRWAAHSLESDDAPTRQPSTSSQPALYISAPIADLVKGLLHGHEQVGTALRHGNFGLGTLHMLDGEVVVLDGVAYQQVR